MTTLATSFHVRAPIWIWPLAAVAGLASSLFDPSGGVRPAHEWSSPESEQDVAPVALAHDDADDDAEDDAEDAEPRGGPTIVDVGTGRLLAENAQLRQRLVSERARSRALLAELERQGRGRLERELAWRDFHGQLSRLRLGGSPAEELARVLGLATVDERRERDTRRAEVDRAIAAARSKADRVRVALNARLVVEGYDGFEIFDAGVLAGDRDRLVGAPESETVEQGSSNPIERLAGAIDDLAEGAETSSERPSTAPADPDTADPATADPDTVAPDTVAPAALPEFGTGPVIVRLLDHRGVLAGSLHAKHMHLEASRSGHSVTIVLLDGALRAGTDEVPFTDGAYRIPLRHVDPKPFLDDCAPLFDPELVERRVDDGRWSRPSLVLTLNRLLAESDRGGRHRLTWLGGVVGNELRDVELSLSLPDGRVHSRLIADGMRIELHPDHVRLVLRDGLVVAGDGARTPFLSGSRSIVLVGSNCDRFRAARLPVVEAPAGAEPAARAPVDPQDAPPARDSDESPSAASEAGGR